MAGNRGAKHAWAAAAIAGATGAAVVAVLAARGGQSAEADQRELQAYRLTMPKVRQMNQAYGALFKALHADPQFQALQEAREELSDLEGKEDLTATDERRIAELEAQIEDAADAALPELGEQQSLSEMVKAIESQPRLAEAIRSSGLAPREFAKIQLALFQAMFAYGFLKAGTIKDLPEEVSAENVAFVKQHEPELMAMAKQWETVEGEADPMDAGDGEEMDEEEEP